MKKTLKYITAEILTGLRLPGLVLSAVLTENGPLNPNWIPQSANVIGSVVQLETRRGNLRLSGDWEFGRKFNGNFVDTRGQFVLSNCVDFDFMLTHECVTGEFFSEPSTFSGNKNIH